MVRLGAVGLSRSYRRSLREAGWWLVALVETLGFTITRDTPPHLVDRILERAVEAAHRDGERLHWVTLGVLSLQKKLKLSGPLLRGTWAAVRGWKQLLPSRSRVPITKYCLDGVLLVMLAEGRLVEGKERLIWWSAALGSWLSFSCLLRPSELLRLRVNDISFPEVAEVGDVDPGLVVVIREPKTRRVWKSQFVLSYDGALVAWLRWWVAGLPRNALLFSLSRYLWAARLQMACSRLSLEECRFTLGSFRSGGATYMFRQNQNLGALQFAGRWKSATTLQHYLHTAFSAHVMGNLSRDARQKLARVLNRKHLLDGPPPFSLQSLLVS